jgi:nitrite reductase/ring-hydroxylating ferredoxin subunit
MTVAGGAVLVGPSAALEDGGLGLRFPVQAHGETTTGFVVRYHGQVYGYLNRCAHVPIELDWAHGEFFESGKRYIMCQTHGAIYTPETGQCAGGPCKGGRLRPIAVIETDGHVFWQPDEILRPPPAM